MKAWQWQVDRHDQATCKKCTWEISSNLWVQLVSLVPNLSRTKPPSSAWVCSMASVRIRTQAIPGWADSHSLTGHPFYKLAIMNPRSQPADSARHGIHPQHAHFANSYLNRRRILGIRPLLGFPLRAKGSQYASWPSDASSDWKRQYYAS